MISRARWPNQQCCSTEGQWLVNQVEGQSHQAQLTKSKKCNKFKKKIYIAPRKTEGLELRIEGLSLKTLALITYLAESTILAVTQEKDYIADKPWMMTTMCKPLNRNRVVPYSTLLYLLIIIITITYCKHSSFSTHEHILHAWRPPRPVAQCRQFQEDAKDASVS